MHAWREKAQMQLHQDRDPVIVANLKKEYQDFYESIGISRSAEQAKDALSAANPNKKRKQSVNPSPCTLFLPFNPIFVSRSAAPDAGWN